MKIQRRLCLTERFLCVVTQPILKFIVHVPVEFIVHVSFFFALLISALRAAARQVGLKISSQFVAMAILTYILSCFLGPLVALYFYLRRYHGYLETTGLPVIPAFLCFGSPPYAFHRIHYHQWFAEKFRQLGRTFARYQGVTPAIITIDPEFIKEVVVKQFDNFTDVITNEIPLPPEQTTLDASRGDTWKALRKMMTPTFTSGKLKGMLEPIEGIAEDTIDHLLKKAKTNPEMDMKPILQGFTLDSISRVAFGMDTCCRRGQDKEFSTNAFKVFDQFIFKDAFQSLVFHLVLLFPGLVKYVPFWSEYALKIKDMAHDIMVQREEQNIFAGDFVDRLREYKKVMEPPITSEMIDAQSMVFLVAGFETTANTLTSMMLYFAMYPDLQEKAYEEIMACLGNNDNVNHENIKEMDYLEACIKETLRMKPPVTEHTRFCGQDTVVCGVPVKKGTLIQLPIVASHYDEEFFPEPMTFNPDRFLKENNEKIIPYTWRPFGAGLRVCIGQRFAMMEIKIMVAKLLQKFQIVQTEQTNLEVPNPTFFLMSHPNAFVKLELRQ